MAAGQPSTRGEDKDIMATRNEPPAGYQQSRSALRRIYGTRAINASAPQSALDDTPSGRQRALRVKGLNDDQILAKEDSRWSRLFSDSRPVSGAGMRPLTMLYNRRPPASTLESIQSMNPNRDFPVPVPGYEGGSGVSLASTSLMPNTDADPSDITGLGGGMSMSPLSFFKQRPRPSILSGAQSWIAPV